MSLGLWRDVEVYEDHEHRLRSTSACMTWMPTCIGMTKREIWEMER